MLERAVTLVLYFVLKQCGAICFGNLKIYSEWTQIPCKRVSVTITTTTRIRFRQETHPTTKRKHDPGNLFSLALHGMSDWIGT